MKRSRVRRSLSREALQLAEGLFSHSVDFGLWLAVYTAALSVPQFRYGQIGRAGNVANRLLDQVNYAVIKNAIQTARKRGWVKGVTRHALPEITIAGKRRLLAVLPRYDPKRVWDGRMHLVTYDIPEAKKRDRWALRTHLKNIGCGMLQESVWMTPYNPIDTIRDFIEERTLKGNILISDMGTDGSIGQEDLRQMIVRIYKLETLNEQYAMWLKNIQDLGEVDQLAVIQYLAILKDDPQLPFALLPTWWKGDKAYEQCKTLLTRVVISLAIGGKIPT